MKIALTGRSGKLGSQLFSQLSKNHEVISFGRHESDFPWSLGISPTVESLDKVEAILHFGWSLHDREKDFHVNVGGTALLAYRAAEMGIPFLFISSVAALSDSYYGRAKLEAEKFVHNAAGVSLRIGLVPEVAEYGIPQTKKLVWLVPNFPTDVHITRLDDLLEFVDQWLVCVKANKALLPRVTLVGERVSFEELFGSKVKIKINIPRGAIYMFLKSTKIFSLRSRNMLDAYQSIFTTPKNLV